MHFLRASLPAAPRTNHPFCGILAIRTGFIPAHLVLRALPNTQDGLIV